MKVFGKNGLYGEFELLYEFVVNETGKRYVAYTKYEKDANGEEYAYISRLICDDGFYRLENIEDEEWDQIQEIFEDILALKKTKSELS